MKKVILSILCIGMIFTSACGKKEKPLITEEVSYDVNVEVGGKYKDDYVELKYIPQGFILASGVTNERRTILEFIKDDENFGFSMRDMGGNSTYDTEDATVGEMTINGNPAVFSTKPNVNILVWTDGNKKFDITGNISQKEMVKIAENTQSLK